MDIIHLGLGLDIAGPIIMIIFIITGAVKAWPYRKTDRQRFAAIYKPYKYWGIGIWLACNVAGLLIILHA